MTNRRRASEKSVNTTIVITKQRERDRGSGLEVVALDQPIDADRRDLGLERHVAGDERDRAVLTERPGEGEAGAGEQRRRERRAG